MPKRYLIIETDTAKVLGCEVDKNELDIKPVMSVKANIVHLKEVGENFSVGYGRRFISERPSKIATLALGYADGYRRSLSGKFYVLIRGKKAPILGRVCMDQMMVDVTDIPDVQLNDRVVLVGRSGEEQITVETIAEAAGSFNYEFVCGISRRVPRIYSRSGKTVHSVHYLLDS